MDELIDAGYDISQNCDKIEKLLGQLELIDPDNIKGWILYAIFQKKIMEDEYGAFDSYMTIKRHEESRNISMKYWIQSDSKYGIKTNAAIIIISGKKQDIGTIIDVNNEIQKIFGYQKKNLIGENVSILMPDIIGVHHNSFLESYFIKDDQSDINEIVEDLVFAQHLNGYLVPSTKIVKLLSNLENGVQFLGFISLSKNLSGLIQNKISAKSEYLLFMILNSYYDILGFSLSLSKLCCGKDYNKANFKKYLENEQKINLKKLYPNLFLKENLTQLWDSEGFTVDLNLEELKVSIISEIMDVYETSEQNTINLYYSIIRYRSIENDIKTMNLNIKLNNLTNNPHLGGYMICTIVMLDRHNKDLLELQEDSKEKIHKKYVENIEDRNF